MENETRNVLNSCDLASASRESCMNDATPELKHGHASLGALPEDLRRIIIACLACSKDVHSLTKCNRAFHHLGAHPSTKASWLQHQFQGKALLKALRMPDPNVYENLLQAGEDIMQTDETGRCVLHWAVEMGLTSIVLQLLDAGADVNAKDAYQTTPLLVAAESGSTGIMDALIRWGASPFDGDQFGSTPLHAATIKGHTSAVELLLSAGACPNEIGVHGVGSPLHVAAMYGHEAITGVLVACGAQLDMKDGRGRNPTEIALSRRHYRVARILIRAEEAEASQARKRSALHRACFQADVKLASSLVYAGADLELADPKGYTALLIACLTRNSELVKMLIAAGARLDSVDMSGATPLHISVRRGHVSTVALLISSGAPLDVKMLDGSTPGDAAVKAGHAGVLNVFRFVK